MHFHALDLCFWGFCEIFGLGVAYSMLYDHALHFIYIFTMFHAFRCVFICWKLCADRFRLGWTHDAIIFSTSHSFHAYVPFLFYLSVLGCDCVMFFFSLSLSDRLHIAPKHKSTLVRNPLHFGSSSSDPHVPPPSHSVLWWKGPLGLLGELF